MKKRIPALLLAFVMALSLLPTTAFADDGMTGTTVSATATLIDSIDLTDEDANKDKTLEKDGYTWNSASKSLTLQNINVREGIKLPKASVIINIKGNCDAGKISREDSGANQATFIFGENGATLDANIEVAGNLNFLGVTMDGGSIDNGNVGAENVLTISNSNITLTKMSWMTNGGIALLNSNLNVVHPKDDSYGQFWVEFIKMDKNSEITSDFNIGNYGNRDLSDFGDVLNYVVFPAGGKFHQDDGEAGTQCPIYVVDANGAYASSFSLKGSVTPAIGDLGSEDKDITIAVDGVTASGDAVYGTTIAWETPTFTYEVAGGATTRWNPETHTYVSAAGAVNGSFDKDSINVKVYNHSNAKIDASCFVGASADATTTSYNVSGYDVTLAVSNPDGNTATLVAPEPNSELDAVSTTFTLAVSGTGMGKYVSDLIASASNGAKLGTVVVVIGKRQESEPILYESCYWYMSKMTRDKVTSITLLDSYTPTGNETETWDASAALDGSVMCYMNGTDLIMAGNGSGRIITSANAYSLFAANSFNSKDRFSSVSHITGLELLDTSNAVSISGMFQGFGQKCDSVSLDLSTFNTSKVERMAGMFNWCDSLESVNLSNWDTSSVKAEGTNACLFTMFSQHKNLKYVTLGENFKFLPKESFSEKDQSSWWAKTLLPTPTAANIPGADGKWYDTNTGIGYTPEELVDIVRTGPVTYVAVNPNA